MNKITKFFIEKKYFILIIIIFLLILVLIEDYKNHYDVISHREKRNKENKIYNLVFGKNNNSSNNNSNNNARSKDLFQDSNFLLQKDKEVKADYDDIIHYLEDYEEPLIENKYMTGCYDNDKLMEQIEPGTTCKLKGRTIDTSIFEKNLTDENGNSLSFAEVCPVTANIDRPISCLYKKNKSIQELGQRVGNIIDNVQDIHQNKISNIDNQVLLHITDKNRLYNKEPTSKFIRYENSMNMNRGLRKDIFDIVNDVQKFSQDEKKKFN